MSDGLCRQNIMARRWVVLVAIAAILLQALLFGWHHHATAVPGHSSPIASLHGTSEPLAPAGAEQFCEICTDLHQHATAVLSPALLPVPCSIGLSDRPPESDAICLTDTRAFRARAPPMIESTT